MSTDAQSVEHEVQELRIKLEIARQEITNIQLEKIELQKEINHLKEQNQELAEDNTSYQQSEQELEQNLFIVRKVSTHIDDINSNHDRLNMKMFQANIQIKNLQTENTNLAKENKKYKIILEQLNEEKQKREETQTKLKNKVKELENECDQLKQDLITAHIANDALKSSLKICVEPNKRASLSRPTHAVYESNEDYFHLPNKSMVFTEVPLLSDIGQESNRSNRSTRSNKLFIFGDTPVLDPITTSVVTPWSGGDDEKQINMPSPSAAGTKSVHWIDEDNKFQQYQLEIKAKMEEIDILKSLNDNNKSMVKTLQKQVKMITARNKELRLEIKRMEKANDKKSKWTISGCFS